LLFALFGSRRPSNATRTPSVETPRDVRALASGGRVGEALTTRSELRIIFTTGERLT